MGRRRTLRAIRTSKCGRLTRHRRRSGKKTDEEGRRDLAEAFEEDGRRKCPHFKPPVLSGFHSAARKEHLAIVKFLESPARGTKEFNQIKELAKMGGFGPVEFQIAHNAAWEVNRHSPERMVANGAEINGSPVDSNDPKHVAALKEMAEALRSAEAAALEGVFGSTNGALINSIFNVSPKIPFFDPKKAGIIPSLTEGTILIRIEDLKEW